MSGSDSMRKAPPQSQYFGVRRLRRRQDEILLQAELNANKQFLSGNFRSKGEILRDVGNLLEKQAMRSRCWT